MEDMDQVPELPQDHDTLRASMMPQPSEIPQAPEIPRAPETLAAKSNPLKRAWRGQEKLWKVFWLYGVVGGIVLQIVLGIVSAMGSVFAILSMVILLAFGIWNLVSLWRCAWNASQKIWGIIVRVLVIISAIGYAMSIIAMAGLLLGASALKSAHMTPVPTTAVSAPVTPAYPPSDSGPITVPAAPAVPNAPATTVPMVATPAIAPAVNECEKRMTDYAIKNNADPKAYIAQNQAYLKQCNAALAKGAH